MGLFNNFPYMDLSNLNLDFVLKKLKDLTNYAESAEHDAHRAETASAVASLARDAAESAARSAESSSRDAQAAENSAENYAAHIADPVGGLVTGWLDDNITPTTPPVDASLSIQGAAADAKATGDAISELRSNIEADIIPVEVKYAIDNLFAKVALYSSDPSNDYATLHAWSSSVSVLSISAVFTQGANLIFTTDTLDVLRDYLVVTASYSDGTSSAVTTYELSGNLTAGTSTITVTYQGKTDTFTVNVTGATDITPDFSNFVSGDSSKVGWSYDASSDALRVYTLPGKTAQYGQARCLFTYSNSKRVRITAKITAVSGSEYTAIQNATQANIIVSQTTSGIGSYVDGFVTIDFDPADYTALTDNQARLALYCTMSPASAGDVTWQNLKIIEYTGV